MSDDINTAHYKLNFVRNMQPKQYESKSCSASVDITVPIGLDQADLDRIIVDAYKNLQVHVLDQLGLPYTVDPTGFVVEEITVPEAVDTVVTQFPGAQAAPAYPVPGPAPAAPSAGPGVCPKCGSNDWWDNREENNQKRAQGRRLGTEWKCKNRNCNGGKGHAIWPEDYDQYKSGPA